MQIEGSICSTESSVFYISSLVDPETTNASHYPDQDIIGRYINFTLGHWSNDQQYNFLHEWILNLDIAFSKKTNWFSLSGNIERIARSSSPKFDTEPISDWMVSYKSVINFLLHCF